MDARMVAMGAIALLGIGVMYLEGYLLRQGVNTWPHLLILAAGGLIGLAVTAIAVGGIARDLFRRG